MKAVLISIQPKWCELIARGQKTIEVRKSVPKLERPFKCYIYCTIGNGAKGDYLVPSGIQCGKVIGEFVCDRIEDFSQWEFDYSSLLRHINLYAGTNGDYKFLDNYLKGEKYGYGWNISNLVIYDKPKELSEFWYIDCKNKKNGCAGCEYKPTCIKNKVRPPQSWCYVEVDNDERKD